MRFEHWDEVERLFQAALERKPDRREEFLAQACSDDAELLQEVKSLLVAEHRAGDFLEEPAVRRERRIGPYRVIRRIGFGGTSSVFLAARGDGQYHKQVAVKLLHREADEPDVIRRFRAERQILASLEHPNIARLIDGGMSEDRFPYLVMEYVDGRPIDAYCDEKRLNIAQRLELFQTVCSAVEFAHRNLIVHRDLKPANILVTAEGIPKLLDFGIAKLLDPERFPYSLALTRTGWRLLTPFHASPEQVRGERITTASDVYSLGVLLYLLLAGRFPYAFRSALPHEAARVICEEAPEALGAVLLRNGPEVTAEGKDLGSEVSLESLSAGRRVFPRDLKRELSGDLATVALKALRKEPEQRYPNIAAFSDDLRRYRDGLPVYARKPTLVYRGQKFLRRHVGAVALATLLVLMLAGSAALSALQASRLARERDQVKLERDKALAASDFLKEIFRAADPYRQEKIETITARELLLRAVERIDSELGHQPELRAQQLHTIGSVYTALGLYDEAEPLLRSSFELRTRLLDDDHLDLADSCSEIGNLLEQQGKYFESESWYQRALDIRRKKLGPEHRESLVSLHRLAVIHLRQGQLDKAEPLFRTCLSLQRQLLDTHDYDLAATLADFSILFERRMAYGEAERLIREALEIRREAVGEKHPIVASSMINLAIILRRQGKHEEAESFYHKGLAINREALGEEHPEVATTLHNLAALHYAQNEYEEAQRLLSQAIAIRRRSLGEDNPELALSLGLFGLTLSALNDHEAAEAYQRQALEIQRKRLGADHLDVAYTLHYLAHELVEQGRFEEAEEALREAVDIRSKTYGADHPRVAILESAMGNCLIHLGRLEEAEKLLLRAHSVLRSSPDTQDYLLRRVANRLVKLYERWERPEEADQFRKLTERMASKGEDRVRK